MAWQATWEWHWSSWLAAYYCSNDVNIISSCMQHLQYAKPAATLLSPWEPGSYRLVVRLLACERLNSTFCKIQKTKFKHWHVSQRLKLNYDSECQWQKDFMRSEDNRNKRNWTFALFDLNSSWYCDWAKFPRSDVRNLF